MAATKAKDGEKCLIVGAGGAALAAAFAAQSLGYELVFYNRTPEKAEAVRDKFGGTVLRSLTYDTIDQETVDNLKVVITTIPSSSGFVLPQKLLKEGLIIFDINYKPYNTGLTDQIETGSFKNKCDVIRGGEMLLEQGIRQSEIWLKRDANYGVMSEVVEIGSKQ
jgi:shikimate 5-dehydrogenase